MTGHDEVGICAPSYGDKIGGRKAKWCTHQDSSLEAVAIERSVFYGLLLVYKKNLKHSKELLRRLYDGSSRASWAMSSRDISSQLDTVRSPDTTEIRSCYDLKILLYKNVRRAIPCTTFLSDCGERAWNWYTDPERTVVSNMVVYYPKWWEHTDLGFVCDLYMKKAKTVSTSFDLNAYKNSHSSPANQRISLVTESIEYIEKMIDVLEYVLGLEALEARYHANDSSKKGKICSPHTVTRVVTRTGATGPKPDWDRLFSHAVLDAKQEFPGITSKPVNTFISGHPYPEYSTDAYRKRLMNLDPRYITYLSTPSKHTSTDDPDPDTRPGMPMLFVPGMDYVAPEISKDPDAFGITVYSYPLAICTPSSDDKRAIRIFN